MRRGNVMHGIIFLTLLAAAGSRVRKCRRPERMPVLVLADAHDAPRPSHDGGKAAIYEGTVLIEGPGVLTPTRGFVQSGTLRAPDNAPTQLLRRLSERAGLTKGQRSGRLNATNHIHGSGK